ncbi:CaiB/BaiF CoA transferase family protein [Achromobacter anxifer]
MSPRILEGVKVLDLTRVIAGPLCTQILADMGATVYKIERPGEGDDTRRMGPFLPDGQGGDSNDSALYLAYNRGKHSVTIDISTPEGSKLAHDLAMRCDIVMENYKVGTLAKYGLDYATLAAQKPGLVYCSLTGFGQSGPYAQRAAYDFILQGLAGVMSTCGHAEGTPGGEPMRTAIPITDVVTGLYAAIAILGALLHQRQTGMGQHVDASMLDASVALNGHLAVGYLMTGQLPARQGNTNPIAAPSEVFACADGRMILAAGNNIQFSAMCDVLERPDLGADPRFATNALRVAHRTELRDLLAPSLAGRRRADLFPLFDRAGVPSGPINDLSQVFEDPQTRHRQLALSQPHARGGDAPMLRSPLDFSATPVRYGPAPTLGQHSLEVLSLELGLDDVRLADLRSRAII